MEFRTKTDIANWDYRLRHSDKLLVMGSCFAEHIGRRLVEMKWRAQVNPFGVLYNPLSISEALERMLACRPYTEDELVCFPDGGWNTWLHYSRYSHPDKGEALAAINASFMQASALLRQADMLIVTLGTAWVYRLKETGQVVGNCHKVPERDFLRQRLTVEEIVDTYTALLAQLWAVNPKLRVLFTVSPVRHVGDGLQENNVSKATLRLAVEELVAKYENASYFPSYEIVVDDLRDYRYYGDDLAHPSKMAVDYIWEKFCDAVLAKSAREKLPQVAQIVAAAEHRPFNPESEEHKLFCQKMLARVEAMPELDFSEEKREFERYL